MRPAGGEAAAADPRRARLRVARLGGALVAMVTSLFLAVGLLGMGAPAHAAVDEADLRSKVHSRLAVFVDDAVEDGYFTDTQAAYILYVISSTEPDSLSARAERRVKGAFWRIITEVGEVSQARAERRLASGATLWRIAGDDAEAVRDRLRDWLVNPVIRAIMEGEISWGDASSLLADTRTAVNRLMAQPGGGRDVILVRKRN